MQTSTPPVADPTLRLYAIVRADLAMPAGKLASQAGHAFLDAYLQAQQSDPTRAAEYLGDGHGTKIALAAPTLEALRHAHAAAHAAGLPCALITDEGHVLPPHFDGSPIVTALGIGPARRDEARAITRRFRLVA